MLKYKYIKEPALYLDNNSILRKYLQCKQRQIY